MVEGKRMQPEGERKRGSLDEVVDEERRQREGKKGARNEEVGGKWTRKGGSLKERGRSQGSWTKWWTRKGGSVRERREVFSVFNEEFEAGAGLGAWSGAWLGAGTVQKTTKAKRDETDQSERSVGAGLGQSQRRGAGLGQSEPAELDSANRSAAELELDTSFSLIGSRSFSCSLIGSQRPLLLTMMSRSSLRSPAHAAPPPTSNQRRGSMLGHAPPACPRPIAGAAALKLRPPPEGHAHKHRKSKHKIQSHFNDDNEL
ncbi:hypothetical protein WMY93_032822 [Mugilogobius chulae]|uniref:Uncharacterized protein n=1 Tax=Mugilogobius chulae TaxID=88201 RepID=A0AAW0MMY2_9GOBI